MENKETIKMKEKIWRCFSFYLERISLWWGICFLNNHFTRFLHQLTEKLNRNLISDASRWEKLFNGHFGGLVLWFAMRERQISMLNHVLKKTDGNENLIHI